MPLTAELPLIGKKNGKDPEANTSPLIVFALECLLTTMRIKVIKLRCPCYIGHGCGETEPSKWYQRQ